MLEHISQTVILMGKSINYTLYQRRWSALSAYYHDKKAIKKVLDNYQDDFAKEDKFLFREKFQKHVINREKTSQKVETALTKTGRKLSHSSSHSQPFPKSPRPSQGGSWGSDIITFQKRGSDDRSSSSQGKVFTIKHSTSQHFHTSNKLRISKGKQKI